MGRNEQRARGGNSSRKEKGKARLKSLAGIEFSSTLRHLSLSAVRSSKIFSGRDLIDEVPKALLWYVRTCMFWQTYNERT